MEYYLLSLFAFLVSIYKIQSTTVKLFDGVRGKGESFNITMYKNDTTCMDLPEDWFSKTSSVNTANLCLVLYSETNCVGMDVAIYPGTDHGDLSLFGFNNKAKSVQVCKEHIDYTTKTRNDILLYSTEGIRIINVVGCHDVEPRLINTIYEIITYGTCFRFYSRTRCVLSAKLESPSNETILKDDFPDMRKIYSIDRCPKPRPKAKNLLHNDTTNTTQTPRHHYGRISRGSAQPSIIILVVLSTVAAILVIMIAVGFWLHRKVRRQFYQQVAELELKNEKLIDEFRNGNPKAFDLISFENADTTYRATNLPYDANIFEIPLSALEMDNRNPLGMGEFGIVIKAKLVHVQKFPEPIMVAVKAVKPGTDSGYVKALLDECKLMMYLRTTHHQHIVNLIGACTENLHKLEPYVVLEYCNNGCLHAHLQRQRKCFTNLVVNDTLTFQKYKDEQVNQDTTDTTDLLKWSSQIADGMHYLSTKKVIHGDLATRNILLDKNFDAKISDFGLSRQLYQYSQYVKKNQAPLPWRWMAIESLQDLSFSTQSDIWAFGVTIWEIFSLGKVPFPGFTWTEDFLQSLKGGYRMKKPRYATTKIYDLLLKCWSAFPESRPSFEDLREEFIMYLAN